MITVRQDKGVIVGDSSHRRFFELWANDDGEVFDLTPTPQAIEAHASLGEASKSAEAGISLQELLGKGALAYTETTLELGIGLIKWAANLLT